MPSKISTKHTPGPWEIAQTKSANLFITNATGKLSVCNSVNGASSAEETANARLIAAAPDLLEAFQRIAAIADKEPSNLHEAQVLRYSSWVFDIARAAIAKATGKE